MHVSSDINAEHDTETDWDITPCVDAFSDHPDRSFELSVTTLAQMFDHKARCMDHDNNYTSPRSRTCAFDMCEWRGLDLKQHLAVHSSQFDDALAQHKCNSTHTHADMYDAALTTVARRSYPSVGLNVDRRCHEHYNSIMNESTIKAGICFCCARVLVATVSDEGHVVCGELNWVKAWNENTFLGMDASTASQVMGVDTYRAKHDRHQRLHGPERHDWVRKLQFNEEDIDILCCPEDVILVQLTHARSQL
jgi:hypothetical protein